MTLLTCTKIKYCKVAKQLLILKYLDNILGYFYQCEYLIESVTTYLLKMCGSNYSRDCKSGGKCNNQ